MPRNRQDIPREDRVVQIVDIAMALFEERDFADVTMVEIARRTGIRSAAVYWYFESKDHLLAAVVDRVRQIGEERIAALPPSQSAEEKLIAHLHAAKWGRPIHASAHARARLSPVVAEAHDAWIAQLRGLVIDALADQSQDDREMLAALIIALFEGANDPGHRGPSATELVAFAFARIAPRPR